MVDIDTVLLDEKRIFQYKNGPELIYAVQINDPTGFFVEIETKRLIGKFGDYLIIDVAGNKRPCDKHIFEETYEMVD